ncbi:MAG: hypothetical protein ALECFALPRED_003921 [Alectoria fallacina]|uniref:DUF7730 domain-containing protein n=1 Tax=Alectoria fallacina TaxID=1903189 RepID=A0A8H3INZ9_9LECA|nr:MAG: hypothetical protein ALECFALPRED_003921 [Alectoria fallacina]
MHPVSKLALQILFYPLKTLLGHLSQVPYYVPDESHLLSYSMLTRYRDSPAKPLPAKRPRSLTLLLPPKESHSSSAAVQKTDEQTQSLLFAKLPMEIRTMIYGMALSGEGQLLHIVRVSPHSISHLRCSKADGGQCRYYECFDFYEEDGEKLSARKRTHGNLLPLTLSCRKVYTEAISTLYSHNTFEFRDLYSLICFPSTILPTRMNQIRSLKLDCIVGAGHRNFGRTDVTPQNDVPWKMVWKIIAGMTELRDLRVDLAMLRDSPSLSAEQEIQLLAPLMAVRQAKGFVVNLRWSAQLSYDDGAGELRDRAFELVHTGPGSHRHDSLDG